MIWSFPGVPLAETRVRLVFVQAFVARVRLSWASRHLVYLDRSLLWSLALVFSLLNVSGYRPTPAALPKLA